jgi:transcription elongation factor
VHVIAEPHAKLTGTVKHINRGTIWLHSNNYLKNSGIFVVKGRNCMIAGLNNIATGSLSSAYSNITSNAGRPAQSAPNSRTPSTSGTPGGSTARGSSRDPAIGTTVRITKGGYKAMLAQIIEATGSHYKVELLAKLKKVIVPKSDVLVAGDKHGSYEKHTNNAAPAFGADNLVAPSTPYLASATPMHMMGSETPYNPGAETPYSAYGSGAFTPSVDYGDDSAWKVTDNDRSAMYSSYDIPNDTGNAAYSSATTPTPSDYGTSPMHGSSGYSFSVPPPPAPPAFPAPLAASDNIQESYIPGMVVLIKHRSHTGRLAVVQSVEPQFKSVAVKIRDGNGRLGADELRFTADDVTYADAAKGASVYVLKGKHKGKSGVVKVSNLSLSSGS